MRFDDRVTGNVRTYAPYARIIHVDIDPAEIGKNVAVEVPIVGDARRVLAGLTAAGARDDRGRPRAPTSPSSPSGERESRGQLVARLRGVARRPAVGRLRRRADRRADRPRGDLRRRRRAEPDVARPLRRVPAARTATSAPAASGRWASASRRRWAPRSAGPTSETWAITGDGGFQMTSQELMTLAADRIPVKIALLDNKKLGMIRQWQEIIYAGNYHSAHLPGPDFVKLAEAYGIPAFQATHARTRSTTHPRRPGGRRAGAHLVRDRRGAERLPDDAGRQGPVRPHRDLGRRRRNERRPSPNGRHGDRPSPPTAGRRQRASRPRAPRRRGAPRQRRAPAPRAGRRSSTNKPGVLNRVASLMRARNFNIDSLAVVADRPRDISRMTITLHGDDVAVEQAAKQLYRLIDVLKVQDVTRATRSSSTSSRSSRSGRPTPTGPRCSSIVELYKGRVLDVAPRLGHRRGTGTEAEIDSLVALLRGFGIKELVRTGAVVMLRGAGSIEEATEADDRADVLRQRRRPARARRADGRDHRLRQPGPRPCPEPPRQRRRRRRRAGARVQEPRRSPRRRACGSPTSRRPSRPPT